MSRPANPVTVPLADYSPNHFLLAVVDSVATVTLNRPERKNPLTFESYREAIELPDKITRGTCVKLFYV
jgi:enoyl-CoA hydratase/carnithine racemase